jgi:hypothetical protein
MAYTDANLSLVNYSGNGFHIWHYSTTDAATVVDTAGYFNSRVSDMNVGDVIFASVDTDGTPGFGIFVVNANNGTVVDVTNMTDLAAGDSD